MEVFVDADACPVKDEVVRVAERHGLIAHMVSNSWMRLPAGTLVRRMVVSEGFDAADDWIAARAGAMDIVITADTFRWRPAAGAGSAFLPYGVLRQALMSWARPVGPSQTPISVPRLRCAT